LCEWESIAVAASVWESLKNSVLMSNMTAVTDWWPVCENWKQSGESNDESENEEAKMWRSESEGEK